MSDHDKSHRKGGTERAARRDAEASFLRHAFVLWASICVSVGLLIDMAVVAQIMIVGFSNPTQLTLLFAGVAPMVAGLMLFRSAFNTIVDRSNEQLAVGRAGALLKTKSRIENADRARRLEESVSNDTGTLLVVSGSRTTD